MHDGWRLASGGFGCPGRLGLQHLRLVIFLAGGAFAADLRWRSHHGKLGRGHPHHLIGDAVRLLLKRIARRVDHELGLDGRPRPRQSPPDFRNCVAEAPAAASGAADWPLRSRLVASNRWLGRETCDPPHGPVILANARPGNFCTRVPPNLSCFFDRRLIMSPKSN
jgi:hypothetical protein